MRVAMTAIYLYCDVVGCDNAVVFDSSIQAKGRMPRNQPDYPTVGDATGWRESVVHHSGEHSGVFVTCPNHADDKQAGTIKYRDWRDPPSYD